MHLSANVSMLFLEDAPDRAPGTCGHGPVFALGRDPVSRGRRGAFACPRQRETRPADHADQRSARQCRGSWPCGAAGSPARFSRRHGTMRRAGKNSRRRKRPTFSQAAPQPVPTATTAWIAWWKTCAGRATCSAPSASRFMVRAGQSGRRAGLLPEQSRCRARSARPCGSPQPLPAVRFLPHGDHRAGSGCHEFAAPGRASAMSSSPTSPGRHEPGTGTIDFAAGLRRPLKETGYVGAVSANTGRRGETLAGLGWMKDFREMME